MSDRHSRNEKRRRLAEQIAQEEQRISEIHGDLEHRRALVSSFKEQLLAIEQSTDEPRRVDEGATGTTALSDEQKVRLFRSLFSRSRGRFRAPLGKPQDWKGWLFAGLRERMGSGALR